MNSVIRKLDGLTAWGKIALIIVVVCLSVELGYAADIQRDTYGVWYIQGSEDDRLYDLFHAMGHAVATDRLWQLELFRRQARGRLAELFGQDQLETDIIIRTMSYSDDELSQGFASLSPDAKEMITGYVAGINLRIAQVIQNPNDLPFEFKALSFQLGDPVLPGSWSPEDVLAWMALVLRNFDGEAMNTTQLDNLVLLNYLNQIDSQNSWDMFQDLRWINDPEARTYLESYPDAIDTLRTAPAGVKTRLTATARRADTIGKRLRQVDENLERINARVKMGSYAWVLSGARTRSGNPIIYAGPQMGFTAPSIVFEGSLQGAGLSVSGMSIAGLPFIVIGRTPHHAWSMQVGHAHTTDYYFEAPEQVRLNRLETIHVAGGSTVTLPVYRSERGPVISPLPLDLSNYQKDIDGPIVSWRYAHWGQDFLSCDSFLKWVRATDPDQFGQGVALLASSQHICYADRDGNIAYWMSGRDPIRYAGEWRLPQGALPNIPPSDWVAGEWAALPAHQNSPRGYYAGWNNRTHPDYDSGYNNLVNIFGPFHRAHVIYDFLDRHLARRRAKISFNRLRDLALNIATTDSLALGGNPWDYVARFFRCAVRKANVKQIDRQLRRKRMRALRLLNRWDGHFVPGRRADWATHPDRSDAWMLMDAWIHEVLRLTFADELGSYFGEADSDPMSAKNWPTGERRVLINVLLHGLDAGGAIQTNYDWFGNADTDAMQNPDEIIVAALDSALNHLGPRPWGVALRGNINYVHPILENIDGLEVIWQTPFASRSTYAQIVELGPDGPVRIESMFPLGQSGTILMSEQGAPVFDNHFFSMTELYDAFTYRSFPTFE